MNCLHKGIDYKGKTVGCYEVLDFEEVKIFPGGQKRKHWRVKCIHCEKIKVLSYDKVVGLYQDGCLSCTKTRFKGNTHFNWKGAQHVTGMYFGKVKKSAEKRNIYFGISREEMEELFNNQNGKCFYTGYDLYFTSPGVSGGGYTKNNVRWVHKDVNTMKWDLSHDEFIKVCKLITENFF